MPKKARFVNNAISKGSMTSPAHLLRHDPWFSFQEIQQVLPLKYFIYIALISILAHNWLWLFSTPAPDFGSARNSHLTRLNCFAATHREIHTCFPTCEMKAVNSLLIPRGLINFKHSRGDILERGVYKRRGLGKFLKSFQ